MFELSILEVGFEDSFFSEILGRWFLDDGSMTDATLTKSLPVGIGAAATWSNLDDKFMIVLRPPIAGDLVALREVNTGACACKPANSSFNFGGALPLVVVAHYCTF